MTLKTPGGKDAEVFNSKRCLGVTASKSSGSSDRGVNERLLMIDSALQNKVLNDSSVRTCSWQSELRILRPDLIWRF